MHLLRQLVGNTRSQIALGIVDSVNDSGGAQTVNVTTGDGVQRANVEVILPFGFTSMPPLDGAICLIFEIGADPSNLMALPIGNPYTRFGGLTAGQAVLYAGDGTRVKVAPGAADIWAQTVTIHSAQTVINVQHGATINGNVEINGSLTASGEVADSHGSLDRLRGHYNSHTGHGSGGATPSAPDPE